MRTVAVEFKDFSGGDVTRKGVHRAEMNQFSALNMLVFRDGTIGPRPGLKVHTTSGMPSGQIHALDWIGFPGRLLGIGVGGGLYAHSTDGDGAIVGGSILSLTPLNGPHGDAPERSKFAVYDPNNYVYFTAPGVKTWRIYWPDPVNGPGGGNPGVAEIQIAGQSRGFNGIKLYRDRLFLFSQHVSQNQPVHRVWFSNPGSFHTFNATNFVDLPGYWWEPYAMVNLGNHAFFPQRQTGWVSWIGASPASLDIRQTWVDPPEIATGSGAAQTAYLVDNGRCWWIQRGGLCVMDGSGFDQRSWAHLGWDTGPADIHGCQLFGPAKDLLFYNRWTKQLLVRHWDTWTMHQFATGVNPTGHMCRTEFNTRVLFTLGTTPASLASLDLGLERPGLVGDTYARPGDNSDTPVDAWLVLPEYNNPEGLDVRCRQLRLSVIKYAPTSGFVAKVEAANIAGPTSGTDGWLTSTQPVTLTGGSPSGVHEKVVLNFGDQGWRGTFRVKLENVYGLAFKQIVVVIDLEDHRHVR